MCKNRLKNDRKIFKIPSLQFQHGISNFRIFCCDFPIFASENFKKKSLIFYPYTFYTTLEKISKKGKYTTRYWQLLLTSKVKEKKKTIFKKTNTSRASIVHLFENFSSCGRQTKKVLSFSIDFELQILEKQQKSGHKANNVSLDDPKKLQLMFCKSIQEEETIGW